MTGAASRRDIYAALTDQIIAAIERGAGSFEMPWRRLAASGHPWNAATEKRYRGINIVSLWLSAEAQAFPHPIWASYRQWLSLGAQVRKGARGSAIIFYRDLDVSDGDGKDADRRFVARASVVFNASQVDGYAAPAIEETGTASSVEPIAAVDALAASSGADIREGGDRAFYAPKPDFIAMPDRTRITGSASMTATEAWYATLLHELVHWTGATHRLTRDAFLGRFGQDAYAMEELVAELGASFLCTDLRVSPALRPDHAAYIDGWLRVLRGDKRAIVSAAARAQEAASFLLRFAPPELGLSDELAPTRPPPRFDAGAPDDPSI